MEVNLDQLFEIFGKKDVLFQESVDILSFDISEHGLCRWTLEPSLTKVIKHGRQRTGL